MPWTLIPTVIVARPPVAVGGAGVIDCQSAPDETRSASMLRRNDASAASIGTAASSTSVATLCAFARFVAAEISWRSVAAVRSASCAAVLAFDALLSIGEYTTRYHSAPTSNTTIAPTTRFFVFTCTSPP